MDTQPIAAEVNPHYLQHLMHSASQRDVQASEDILCGNGVKLLAKGARIDASTQARLLQHRLAKPLETCLSMGACVDADALRARAERLLADDPVLAHLCPAGAGQPLAVSLGKLPLSGPVQALITLLDDQQRLDHAVRVALLSLAQARRLLPGQVEEHRTLTLAGLLHDVGELYLDPEVVDAPDQELDAWHWRPIATHPLVGHQVLLHLEGTGPEVAARVLEHHERLDGFGYPRGIAETAFALSSQILAAAEWLATLMEAGPRALLRASAAARLVPGEFHPALLGWVHQAAQCGPAPTVGHIDGAVSLERFEHVARCLQQARTMLPQATLQQQRASTTLRTLIDLNLCRMRRLLAGFSSSGLDSLPPEMVLSTVLGASEADLHHDLVALLDEFAWRLRELEREAVLRSARLPDNEARVLQALFCQLRDAPVRAAA
ncbi:HD-GYP domain-containing protein [Inhella gelatinilytica]|uniref:HD domain-containing protein n=1 Tax=Inhella gelatinilytica TaxID=2795030 RepID=A0A931NBU9_9BURK|nr:HD domain-containing phosphohydrolase [Inhella gelatinilytica]MBH9551312.1 HD domain-containing protein [Inhella gelatinilytica]